MEEVTTTYGGGITLPDISFIDWEVFSKFDVRPNGGHFLENFAKAVLPTMADLFNGVKDFEFGEPKTGDRESEFELESTYRKIVEELGSNSLKDRNGLIEILTHRSLEDDDAPQQEADNIEMLEAFGWPTSLQELTNQINLHFYQHDDFSSLVKQGWFRDYLVEIISEVYGNNSFSDDLDYDSFFRTIDAIALDSLENHFDVPKDWKERHYWNTGLLTSLLHSDEHVTFLVDSIDREGIRIELEVENEVYAP